MKKTPYCAVCTIVERGAGQKVARAYTQRGLGLHHRISGNGTASSDLLDILGIGTSERDILISPARRDVAQALVYQIHRDGIGVRAKGIMFLLPITAASLRIVRAMGEGEKEEITMEKGVQQSLIVISVAQGYTDEVMTTAKTAGARGGTVIRSHIIRGESDAALKGATFAGERELIIIVASRGERNAIMESVDRTHGGDSAARAILYALPIEDTAHLS